MGDENPIRTLGDYSKPSHEGYRNTIELLIGNNVIPLRSDTIRLVQNGCSFHGLRSEDPNQHLKDFIKLVDSLDLDGDNRERTRLRLFQLFLHDQASNWLERLPAGSIPHQVFGVAAWGISIFSSCYLFRNLFSSTTMGDENHIRTLRDYSKPSYEGYKNTIELLVENNVVPLRSDTIRLVQNRCSFHGLQFEDPNQHLKDFLKLVDSFDLDGENREKRCCIYSIFLTRSASNLA
ncbi:hypothetical protein Tco_1227895 [Tanacetum coccineum]